MKSALGPSLARTALAVVLLGCAGSWAAAAKPKPPIANPDFTRGDKPGDAHDWTLGPTGARGWIFSKNGHSATARQILVTAVAKGSPADGALEVGDVILGVAGGNFTSDARVAFADAIMRAEADTAGRGLRLVRWRDGKTGEAVVRLAALGAYSATAPYDCPKSRRIFEEGCKALAERMGSPDYPRHQHPIPRAKRLGAGGER